MVEENNCRRRQIFKYVSDQTIFVPLLKIFFISWPRYGIGEGKKGPFFYHCLSVLSSLFFCALLICEDKLNICLLLLHFVEKRDWVGWPNTVRKKQEREAFTNSYKANENTVVNCSFTTLYSVYLIYLRYFQYVTNKKLHLDCDFSLEKSPCFFWSLWTWFFSVCSRMYRRHRRRRPPSFVWNEKERRRRRRENLKAFLCTDTGSLSTNKKMSLHVSTHKYRDR